MLDPVIIQGGMGIAVSNWRLAQAVSKAGQLGVVSGTALDIVLARRLQMGDSDGHIRRALAHFPQPSWAQAILEKYFIPEGKSLNQLFKSIPFHSLNSPTHLTRLTIVANFVEVFLAKEGHSGFIGINLLEKIQLPTLPSLFGAMLAGVDYVLMGAGIPKNIPNVLQQFAQGNPAELKIDVLCAPSNAEYKTSLNPRDLGLPKQDLRLPKFFPIISSAILASALVKKSNGPIDGFIVEGHKAGGHNAPPRGKLQKNSRGEPVYGERDDPEIEKMRSLGLPFWMAGSYAHPEKVSEAIRIGARGVQVGTAFAYCEESGIHPSLKKAVLEKVLSGTADVYTDPLASPTGFPFKVLQMNDSLSESSVYLQRKRICDKGYLRRPYHKSDSTIGYRCPGEPVAHYLRKGGAIEDTVNRKCICNGLAAAITPGHLNAKGEAEKPILTCGDDVTHLSRFLKPGKSSYTAVDVIEHLLAGIHAPPGAMDRNTPE
jgi:nitronate monooxygenase